MKDNSSIAFVRESCWDNVARFKKTSAISLNQRKVKHENFPAEVLTPYELVRTPATLWFGSWCAQ